MYVCNVGIIDGGKLKTVLR